VSIAGITPNANHAAQSFTGKLALNGFVFGNAVTEQRKTFTTAANILK
jgi:hypothetical protein